MRRGSQRREAPRRRNPKSRSAPEISEFRLLNLGGRSRVHASNLIRLPPTGRFAGIRTTENTLRSTSCCRDIQRTGRLASCRAAFLLGN
jgi:hypothetical protein